MMPQRILTRKFIPHVLGCEGAGLGSGKTITLVAFAYLAYEMGREVFTNISSLKFEHRDFYEEILPNLDAMLSGEMEQPSNAFYGLDDVNKIWESRRAMGAMEMKMSHFIQDVRKSGSMCMFSAPDRMWADVRLWDLIDLMVIASFDEETNTLYWTVYDPWARTIVNRLEFDAKPLFDLYDTLEKIRTPLPEQKLGIEHDDQRTCPECGSKGRYSFRAKEFRCECGNTWRKKKR